MATCENCEGNGEVCDDCGLTEEECLCDGVAEMMSCADCQGTGIVADDGNDKEEDEDIFEDDSLDGYDEDEEEDDERDED